jgi:hypothetical protein
MSKLDGCAGKDDEEKRNSKSQVSTSKVSGFRCQKKNIKAET